MQGDYNTEALIFKMATAWFLYVFEEETNKMNEISGKCFSHTPLGPGAGIRSRDTKGGQFFLLLSAIT